MAEVHVLGEIIGASGYDFTSLFCKYTFEAGSNFRLVEGQISGQTHCDMPMVRAAAEIPFRPASDPGPIPCPSVPLHTASPILTRCGGAASQEDEMAVLTHPLDVHYAVKGIDGWPRIRLEVYGVDRYGRVEIAGYGCCLVPTAAGTHELRCSTWRPCGSMREQFKTFFFGGAPRLKFKELITTPDDRFRLQTEPAGDVLLRLSVLPKDMARYGVLC